MKKLTVNTKNNSYDILIKNGILKEVFSYLPSGKRFFLVTNDNLEEKYSSFVSQFENKIIIKDGEEHKNFETFQFIVEKLLEKKIERKDTVVVFGGGVTGDLAGYAASSVLRGVDFIQIPTTLLAQVDSSVGGKTGFNTKYGKNLVGAFYQPKAVLIDPNVLNTLPERQIKTGLGEVVKYAFIEKTTGADSEFFLFDYLNSDNFDYSDVIYKSCGLKASVVSSDEKEQGLRAILNFGHTFAHAIETITGYNKFTHGEAVVMGMKSAFELALNIGLINTAYKNTALSLIDKYNIIDNHKIDCNKDDFIQIMKSDKKVQSSKIRLVLPVKRGEVKIFDDITVDEIKKVI